MSHTRHSSARKTACLVALAMTLASACGTTEGRTNDDLEPGSGELGPGDVVDPDEAQIDEEPEEPDVDVDATTPSTVATSPGASCGMPDAEAEILGLARRLFESSAPADDRSTALQIGQDPQIADLLDAAPTYALARVTKIVCVDDGSATISIELGDREITQRSAGSVMRVDGFWRVTLHAFCRWTGDLCTADIEAQAFDALSPALREHVGA